MALAAQSSYGYDDYLHPPAIVHIPEGDPNDAASPANDSPLSSPPNSLHGWDVGGGGMDEDEEDNTNNHNYSLELPSLNHVVNGEHNDEPPFDEGNSADYDNTKVTALHSIRDERMQRKMRRRQQFLTDPESNGAPGSIEHIQQKLQELQQKQEQLLNEQEDEEDQPFDHDGTNYGIPAATVLNAPKDSQEEQPFDAASMPPELLNPAVGSFTAPITVPQENLHPTIDDSTQQRHAASQPELTHTHCEMHHHDQREQHFARREQTPTLELSQKQMSWSSAEDIPQGMPPAALSHHGGSGNAATETLLVETGSSLQRRIQRHQNTGAENQASASASNKMNRPMSAVAASLATSTSHDVATQHVPRPYSPAPGAIPPPVIHSAAVSLEEPIKLRSSSPLAPSISRAISQQEHAEKLWEESKWDVKSSSPTAPKVHSRQPLNEELMATNPASPGHASWERGGSSQRWTKSQPMATEALVVDLTGYVEEERINDDIPDDERRAVLVRSKKGPGISKSVPQRQRKSSWARPEPRTKPPTVGNKTPQTRKTPEPKKKIHSSELRQDSNGASGYPAGPVEDRRGLQDKLSVPDPNILPADQALVSGPSRLQTDAQPWTTGEQQGPPIHEHHHSIFSDNQTTAGADHCEMGDQNSHMQATPDPKKWNKASARGRSTPKEEAHHPRSSDTTNSQHPPMQFRARLADALPKAESTRSRESAQNKSHHVANPEHDSNRRLSPNLGDRISREAPSEEMDDDASWLARRLQSREQQQNRDEDASWLADRLGAPESNSIDAGVSWLAGRLEHSAPSVLEPVTARRKSDAPGATPVDPQGSSRSDNRKGRGNGSTLVVQNHRSPAQVEVPSYAGLKSDLHRKVQSVDYGPQGAAQASGQLARRAISEIPKISTPEESAHDEASNSQISADIGSLIESLDEMVKDLETSFNPGTPEKGHPAVVKSSLIHLDDAHSTTQATSTLSLSNTSEKQTVTSTSVKPSAEVRPVLVQPINNDIGIPKGDIMISLLSENIETPWHNRISEALWRCRLMRQNCDTKWLRQKLERKPNTPSNGRTSVLVDVDDVKVVGGIESVAASQKAALEHLKYDDLDDAVALYEDILETYYSHFENRLKQNTTVEQLDEQVVLFNSYIGACLHNIGLVYLLLDKPKEAYNHFERAATKRSACLGVGHTDHLASHVKAGICHVALGRHTEAVVVLEACLTLSKEGARSISDQRQVAEIYNNLACLYYALGNHEKSSSYLMESFEAQTVALEHSLYAGARFSCHSATLNLAVTKANIGFLALVSRNHEVAIESLEYAVHNQQLLLRDAHTTLIATMDHLVVAQIFAGNKDKAIRLLRRMYHMQSDTFGSSDERCMATSKKLRMLEEAETQSDELFDESVTSEEKRRPSVFKLLKSMARK